MVEKDTLIVVHDADLKDVYVARLAFDTQDLTARNPFVYVLRILHYPIQHAIIWTDVANENPPMQEGAFCQLAFLRFPTQQEAALVGTYADSLRDALQVAIDQAEKNGRQDMLAILQRHQEGVFRGRSRARNERKEWRA